jgi:hypothetical protein
MREAPRSFEITAQRKNHEGKHEPKDIPRTGTIHRRMPASPLTFWLADPRRRVGEEANKFSYSHCARFDKNMCLWLVAKED